MYYHATAYNVPLSGHPPRHTHIKHKNKGQEVERGIGDGGITVGLQLCAGQLCLHTRQVCSPLAEFWGYFPIYQWHHGRSLVT